MQKGKGVNSGKWGLNLKLFQHAPVGTASSTENNSILPSCITFRAEGSGHFTPLMDDNSASQQLWEELNVVFQNLQKGLQIVTCPRRAVSQTKLNCLTENPDVNSETTSSTPAHGAL